MAVLGFILALNVIAFSVFLLLRKHNAAVILIFMGLLMSLLAIVLNISNAKDTVDNFLLFYLFEKLSDTFSSTLSGIGLTVMLLCGYVEYMKRIKASNAFTYLMTRPLVKLTRFPDSAGVILIPIGLLLNLAIPSASGVALLLVATVYPLLVKIGMDRVNALSAISACTLLDYGINSHTTVISAGVIGMQVNKYFDMQMKHVVPMIAIITVVFFLFYMFWDKRNRQNVLAQSSEQEIKWENDTPLYYAYLPVLPLLFSFTFSAFGNIFANRVFLGLNSAVLLSFFISGAIDIARTRSFSKSVSSMSTFWNGMGDTFSSTVVMILAASIFAQGLVDIGLIDVIIDGALSANIGKSAILLLMVIATFISTVLTGSGNAPAAAYAQAIPELTIIFDVDPASLMLPVQLISGIGRAITPISVVVIVLAEFGEIGTFRLVKRNLIPVSIVTILSIILFIIYPV